MEFLIATPCSLAPSASHSLWSELWYIEARIPAYSDRLLTITTPSRLALRARSHEKVGAGTRQGTREKIDGGG